MKSLKQLQEMNERIIYIVLGVMFSLLLLPVAIGYPAIAIYEFLTYGFNWYQPMAMAIGLVAGYVWKILAIPLFTWKY